MPTKPVQRITTWSFSRWNDYEQCPYKAKLKHIDKLKEPGSAAMDRGLAIHKLAEQFVNGGLKTLPEELQNFKEEFKALKKLGAATEQQRAFTKDWTPTGWFDSDAWCRVIVDASARQDKLIRIIDHKTGKVKDGLDPQLELYAIAGLILDDEAEEVRAELWFLDHGVIEERAYTIDDLPDLKRKWATRTAAMLKDTTFKPKPNDGCRWCHFRKSNNGPCRY